MYTASVDADTRSQSPLLQLRRGVGFKTFSLDLIDRHTSTLIIEEIRSRGSEALVSTIAVAITSLLTVFSASLFFATTLPAVTQVQLNHSSLVYYGPDTDSLTDDNSLSTNVAVEILLHNASYPAFTYQDLAFPGLVLNGRPPSHFAQSSNIYNVTVPAIRPHFSDCRLYNSSHIDVKISNYDDSTNLNFEIIPEKCGLENGHFTTIDFSGTNESQSYFGYESFMCSSHIFLWGLLKKTPGQTKPHVQWIQALGCNDTLQIVETSVEFNVPTMTVNSHSPPIPDYENAITLTPPRQRLDYTVLLPWILSNENNANLETIFRIITSSRYAIPISYLGDASKVSAVIESIQLHWRIFVVQVLDNEFRFGNKTSAKSTNKNLRPVWDEPKAFNATARDPSGRNRVVQDAASTRVLQSLLAVVLVCLSINWYLMRNVNVVPRSPTSIANWMALLADGNLRDFLPPNAAHMSLDNISRWHFGQDALFYLGFRKHPETGKEVLRIYVVSEHSGLDKPEELGSSWCKRLWEFVTTKFNTRRQRS
ncbi:hypothetical protein F4808DRAFT_452303 [Astrocystis sublimbata]|nr:hypothetical protein F4808DRAFT_452303 [Astrocystis sublimbata]